MGSIALLGLFFASTVIPADKGGETFNCNVERLTLATSVLPVVVENASLESPPDSNPDTLQLFVVRGISASESRSSEDGQAIYVPYSPPGNKADPVIGTLFEQAIDRRLLLKLGVKCGSLAEGGT